MEDIKILVPVSYSIQVHDDRNREKKQKNEKEGLLHKNAKQPPSPPSHDSYSQIKNPDSQIILEQDIELINQELSKTGNDLRVEWIQEENKNYLKIYSLSEDKDSIFIKEIPSEKLKKIISTLITGEGILLNMKA